MVGIKAQFGAKVEFAFVLVRFTNPQNFLQIPECCTPVAWVSRDTELIFSELPLDFNLDVFEIKCRI